MPKKQKKVKMGPWLLLAAMEAQANQALHHLHCLRQWMESDPILAEMVQGGIDPCEAGTLHLVETLHKVNRGNPYLRRLHKNTRHQRFNFQ